MCYSHPLYHPECCPCSIYTFLQTNETLATGKNQGWARFSRFEPGKVV